MDLTRGTGPLALDERRQAPDALEVLGREIVVADRHPELTLQERDDVEHAERIDDPVPQQRIIHTDVALSSERKVLHDEARELLPDDVRLHRDRLLGPR